MIMMFAELCLIVTADLARDYNMFISLVPETFFLFYIATHISLPQSNVFKKLRIMSILIFFGHTLVIFFVSNLFEVLGRLGLLIPNSLIQFFLIVAICIVVSYAIEELSQKERYKVLRHLYS